MIENIKSFKSAFKSSIAKRFIALILIFSSVITILLTSHRLYIDYSRDISVLENQMHQIELSYLEGVAQSLWIFDQELLNIQLSGIMRLPDMKYLEILKDGKPTLFVGDRESQNIILYEFPMSYNHKGKKISLGTLYAAASLEGIYQRLIDKAFIILLGQAFKTFFVSLFIFIIFYRLVGRHLTAMAEYAASFNLKQLERPLVLDRENTGEMVPDELESVAAAVNAMRVNLAQDMADRLKAEEELRLQSEIMTRMSEGVYLVGMDGIIVYANPKFEVMFGYDPGEMIGKHASIVNYPTEKRPEETAKELIEKLDKDGVWQGEIKSIKKDGTPFWSYASVIAFEHYRHGKVLVAVHNDITTRKQLTEQIGASLREKEVLLQEVHHRVKNNMQVIIALLKLQSDKVNDKQYALMLKESCHRIETMALIHEHLYQSKDLAEINFNEYATSLVNKLLATYAVGPAHILPKIHIEDISIGLDNAIACGLIINELVSNSLKYAFPGNRNGEIGITFRLVNENEVELSVSDDGIGLPEDFDLKNTKSLGLYLVVILAEDQLDGIIELNRTAGVKYLIRFKRRIDRKRT